MLDGIGGYACYGLIENGSDQDQDPGLPICLAQGVTLTKPVGRDSRLRLGDVAYDPDRADFRMHRYAVEQARKA
jgi:predicted homoserine dehydrogenase-like protein